MPQPKVSITLESHGEVVDKAIGRKFITALCQEPLLIPEQIDISEAYQKPYLGIEDFVDNWWAQKAIAQLDGESKFDTYWGPFWRKRGRLGSSGHVNHGLETIKGDRTPTNYSFNSKWAKSIDFFTLFCSWLDISTLDIARLHILTDTEANFYEQHADEETLNDFDAFQLGLFGGKMHPGIPNISWAMAYGEKYFDVINFDVIRAAGFPVDILNKTAVVRVTENLSDVINDYPRFAKHRAELKTLFPKDMFNIKLELFFD